MVLTYCSQFCQYSAFSPSYQHQASKMSVFDIRQFATFWQQRDVENGRIYSYRDWWVTVVMDWFCCSEGPAAVAWCQDDRHNIRHQPRGAAITCNVLHHQCLLLPITRCAHHDCQLPYLLPCHGSRQGNRCRQPVPVSEFCPFIWCIDVLISNNVIEKCRCGYFFTTKADCKSHDTNRQNKLWLLSRKYTQNSYLPRCTCLLWRLFIVTKWVIISSSFLVWGLPHWTVALY